MRRLAIALSVAVTLATTISHPSPTSAEIAGSQLAEAESIASSVADGSMPISALTEHQMRLLNKYTTPGELKVTSLGSGFDLPTLFINLHAGEYCREDGARFERKALLGNVLYTFWQKVEICGIPGVSIRNVTIIDSGGETKTPTWSYNGQASAPSSFRVGNGWHVRTSENFEQHFVIHGVGIGQRTECISADIAPTGEYHANENCG